MVHTLAIVREVQKYPLLWNKTDPNYKNIQLRKETWLEICHTIFRDFDNNSKDLKAKRMTIVQRKWRSSRDYFVKRQKTKPKFKQYSSSKYLRALSFLGGTSTNIEAKMEEVDESDHEENAENDDDEQYFENVEEHFEDPSTDDNPELLTEVRIEDPVMINAINYSDHGTVKSFDSLDEFDANKSFAMTMIKEMNGMTEQQNFQFRMEVMKALNTVKYKLPEYSKLNED